MPNTALAERMLRSIVEDPGFFLESAHPDLAVEFPFGEANGFPTRITGRENLEAFLANMPNILPKLTFHDVRIEPFATPGGFLLEYRGTCLAVNNYSQQYISVMRFSGDKLLLFREYYNTAEVTRAFSSSK
jgi:uncharacterized protein